MYTNDQLTTQAVALDNKAGRLLLAAVLWAFIGSWAALWLITALLSAIDVHLQSWLNVLAVCILPTAVLLCMAALARTRAQQLRRARQ